MIETFNSVGEWWCSWAGAMAWQVALLALVVWLIDLVLRRRGWPQVRYALWALVFVKLFIPPGFALPSSVFSRVLPAEEQAPAAIALQEAPPAGPAEPARFEPLPPAVSMRAPAEALPATPLPAERATGASLSFKIWAMLASGAVSLLLLAWLVARALKLHRLILADSRKPTPDWIDDVVGRSAQRVGLGRVPRVVVTGGVKSAAVYGIFRPVLLLPRAACEVESQSGMEHIMLHELAHVKRGDLVMNTAQALVQVGFWFHPAVWLAGMRLRHLRELCCDASVSRLLRERTSEYRETLADAARSMVFGTERPGLGLLGLFESASQLRQRLEHLERPSWKHPRLKVIASLAAVALMVACIVPMARSAEKADIAPDPKQGGANEPIPFETNPLVWMLQEPNLSQLACSIPGSVAAVLERSTDEDPIWGEEKPGAARLKGAVRSDKAPARPVILAFFAGQTWENEPVQLRRVGGLGDFEFGNLPPGSYWIAAISGDPSRPDLLGVHSTWPEEVILKADAAGGPVEILMSESVAANVNRHLRMISAQLPRPAVVDPKKVVMGRVVDSNGKPIRNATVHIREVRKPGQRGIAAPNVSTDEEGFYFYAGVEWQYRVSAARHILRPDLPGYVIHSIRDNRHFNDPQGVDFVFGEFPTGPGEIRGRVVDDAGRPVPRFATHVTYQNDNGEGDTSEGLSFWLAVASEDGNFTLRNLPTGNYIVSCVNLKYYEPSGFYRDVQVTEDKPADVQLVMRKKYRLYLRVVDASNKEPIANARLTFDDPSRAGRLASQGRSDREGILEVGVSKTAWDDIHRGQKSFSLLANDYKHRTFSGGLLGDTPETAKTVELEPRGRRPLGGSAVILLAESQYLDLETVRLFTEPAGLGSDRERLEWVSEIGADLQIMSAAATAVEPIVAFYGMALAPVTNERWDDPSLVGLFTESAAPLPSEVTIRRFSLEAELPATYAFRTREGSIGVLQIQKFFPKQAAIQYKLLSYGETGQEQRGAEEEPAAPAKEGASFGPVIERVVGASIAIDFDKGVVLDPAQWHQMIDADDPDSIATSGIDAFAIPQDPYRGLSCADMVVLPAEDFMWETADPPALREYPPLKSGIPGTPVFMTAKGELPATYMFKTREGGMGILQILGFTEDPPGVKIRYKMVQGARSRAGALDAPPAPAGRRP